MHNKVKSTKNVRVLVANGQGVMLDPNPSDVQGEWKRMPGISSTYVPVKGSFVVKASEESDSGIPGEVLEPRALAALVGVASAMFVAERGKKRQAE
jgi:hypothetical protein